MPVAQRVEDTEREVVTELVPEMQRVGDKVPWLGLPEVHWDTL